MTLVDTVFCQAPNIHRPHRCGDIKRSRTVKTKASAREPLKEALRASISCGPRAVLTRPAGPKLSRTDAKRMGVKLSVPRLLAVQTLAAPALPQMPAPL